MYPPITYSLLVEKNACQPQLDLFEKHFGKTKAIPLTKKVVTQFSSVFDINWASENLLTQEDLAEYNKAHAPIWAEYNKAHAPIWAEYNKAHAPIWAEYNKAYALIWAEYNKAYALILAEYDKAQALIFAEYNKAHAPILAEYKKAHALEFIRIYKKGMKKTS
jgi:L-rhamnose mutarotase